MTNTLEEFLKPLNDPANRTSVEDYARTWVSVADNKPSSEEDTSGEYWNALKMNSVHFAIEHQCSKYKMSPAEEKYYHAFADIIPEIGTLRGDFCEEQDRPAVQALKERQIELTKNLLSEEFDVPGFLRVAYRTLGVMYQSNSYHRGVIQNEDDNGYRAVETFAHYLVGVKEFHVNVKEFQDDVHEQTRIPHIKPIRGSLYREIMTVVEEGGASTKEQLERLDKYSHALGNSLITFNEIGNRILSYHSEFPLSEYFQEVIEQTPGLKDELIEEGRQYGIEWKF